jgi:hypothetical protein
LSGVRWRTLTAGTAILVGLAVYAAAVVSVGDLLPDHWAIELAFYAVAGVAWVIPAAWLIAWAKRDDI